MRPKPQEKKNYDFTVFVYYFKIKKEYKFILYLFSVIDRSKRRIARYKHCFSLVINSKEGQII
jgi:hypothetical protein